MAIVDLYSKRQKRARGEVPDVYVYDNLPQPLRVQIVHIIRDAFSDSSYGISYRRFGSRSNGQDVHEAVEKILCRELGVFELPDSSSQSKDPVFVSSCRQNL